MREHERVPRHRVLVPLRWSDTDMYGHVNNVMILRLLEEARVAALGEDWLNSAQQGGGTALLVARQEVEYLSPLTYRVAPVPIDASDFELGYEVLDEGVIYARAETTLFTLDQAAQRPRRLTEPERKQLLDWAGEPIRWRRRREKTAVPR
jgi:acyl-CoA thioester hydrolase